MKKKTRSASIEYQEETTSSQKANDRDILRAFRSNRLMFGPYRPPEVKIGEELTCCINGLQVVGGWHGPMQWPRAKSSGHRRLIVCGDLKRALELETRDTISLYWGISESAVAKWRKKLGLQGNPTEAGKAFRSSDLRVKRKTDPETWIDPGMQALYSLSDSQRRDLGRRTAGDRCWTTTELKQLATLSNETAVRRLGRSRYAIVCARQRYHVPPPSRELICGKCGYKWTSYISHMPKECPKCSAGLVVATAKASDH